MTHPLIQSNLTYTWTLCYLIYSGTDDIFVLFPLRVDANGAGYNGNQHGRANLTP